MKAPLSGAFLVPARVDNGLVAPSTRADELAALRRRAYGPDADIQDDPRALARLAELERAIAPVASAQPDEPATDEAPAPARSAGQKPFAPPTSHPTGRWRNAIAVVAVTASVIAAIALGALAFERVNRPQPVARFPALAEPSQGTAFPLPYPELLREFDFRQPFYVPHGEYGALDMWSATGPRGRQCLIVSVGGEVPGFACTVRAIETIVDIRSQNSWMPDSPDGGPIPNGSTVRFVLHDGVIDVYVGRASPPVERPEDDG